MVGEKQYAWSVGSTVDLWEQITNSQGLAAASKSVGFAREPNEEARHCTHMLDILISDVLNIFLGHLL